MYRPTDTPSDIYIWDWVVRLCHWGLVATFVTNDKKQHQQIASYLARLEKLMHPKAVREAKRPLDS